LKQGRQLSSTHISGILHDKRLPVEAHDRRLLDISFLLNGRHSKCHVHLQEDRKTMLHWSLIFLIIAVIAAVLGFGGIAGAAAGIAKILFLVFLVIWILAFFVGRRAL